MSTEVWKLTLPCTRAEAEALQEPQAGLADLASPPVIVATEPEPSEPERWRLDAYFEGKPSRDLLRRVAALAPSARLRDPRARPLIDEDWLTLSQAGFAPLIAGRFHVRTPEYAARGDLIDVVIPAGLAFGTGQHATTAGCLVALDALKQRGRVFRHILDLGTGTGLLAFAAARLWRSAYVTASDIDPVAIAVVRKNARMNGIRGVRTLVADGLDGRELNARAPFDLIIANILAQPLIDLAPSIAATLAPGGVLILAGLLDTQVDAVCRAYTRQRLTTRLVVPGEWPVVLATAPRWR